MQERRVEERRKENRRETDKEKEEIKSINLITLIIIMIIIIVATVFGIEAVKKHKERKAIENIDKRYSGIYSCDFKLEGNNMSLLPGSSATFEMKATNIKAEKGIVMLEGLLDYDYNIFQCDVVNDDNGLWNKVSLIEDYLIMTRTDLMPSSEDQTLGKLVVKVRENAPKGNYTIKLLDCIFAMEDSKDFSVEDTSLSLEVK